MESFGLIVGHLLGDYIFQNDWMAGNKSNPRPALTAAVDAFRRGAEVAGGEPARREALVDAARYEFDVGKCREGAAACLAHCAAYTLCVWACSWWWMPWWGLAVCMAAHYPLDRHRLARWWMENVSGQKAFATGPLSPWSVIVVDNTFHLLTLFFIAAASRAA